MVETTPAEVGASAISKYLEVKAQGLALGLWRVLGLGWCGWRGLFASAFAEPEAEAGEKDGGDGKLEGERSVGGGEEGFEECRR